MENFTIHIFGYGETQINSKNLSVKTTTANLTNVTPLVDAVWAKKPVENTIENNFHAINVFGYEDVRWLQKDGFSVRKDAELKPLIDALIAELQIVKDNLPV